MLVEPAKSAIADCRTISDPTIALKVAWRTLHGIYTTTNMHGQLVHNSNKTAVELSETGLRELITDLYACEAKASIDNTETFNNEFFPCTFAKRLPLQFHGELATNITDLDPPPRLVLCHCCVLSGPDWF